jgi:hypothetical protein
MRLIRETTGPLADITKLSEGLLEESNRALRMSMDELSGREKSGPSKPSASKQPAAFPGSENVHDMGNKPLPGGEVVFGTAEGAVQNFLADRINAAPMVEKHPLRKGQGRVAFLREQKPIDARDAQLIIPSIEADEAVKLCMQRATAPNATPSETDLYFRHAAKFMDISLRQEEARARRLGLIQPNVNFNLNAEAPKGKVSPSANDPASDGIASLPAHSSSSVVDFPGERRKRVRKPVSP